MIETTNLHQQSRLRPHTVAGGASPSKAVEAQLTPWMQQDVNLHPKRKILP